MSDPAKSSVAAPPIVEIVDLEKRHGDLDVLRGISMRVAKGSVHVVIGPSGGGKSTFLRCINGLEMFHRGRVRVGDHVLSAETNPRRDAKLLEGVRRTAGFVFQQFNLFPHLSVIENLTLAPIEVLGETREGAEARAIQLLERVGIEAKARARPAELSGGQQQRVAIARALMMKPAVLLLDEPTSALDPVMAGEVLSVMAELARDGQTMIVVTHSMGFARAAATTVHLFADGRDIEEAPPTQFFDAPENPVTKAFLSRVSG